MPFPAGLIGICRSMNLLQKQYPFITEMLEATESYKEENRN